VARLKIAYVGGGSTRAAGTVSSFIERADDFAGSEIVLIDLDQEHLDVVARFARRLAESRGVEFNVTTTTDRRAGLRDCDAVLTSFRPGGFEMRALDERIPLRHGVIGQETQGPGGFFMALRSIHVMGAIAAEVEELCPSAWIFNYTNPINIVAQALVDHTPVPTVSLCEGSIVYPRFLLEWVGLEPARAEIEMVGLNHATWSTTHTYGGKDLIPLLHDAFEEKVAAGAELESPLGRQLRLAATMEAIPSEYFQYYYFRDELVRDLGARPTTRAEDILREVPGYWEHYREQAASDRPSLDPTRSRIGIHELELAVDVMAAMFNGRTETHYVNVRNAGALVDFPDDLVVELPGRVAPDGIRPLPGRRLPRHVSGLVEMLAEYQLLAAEAAWSGTRKEAVRALAANPLVLTLSTAERLYDEMAHAQREFLPERLLH
jgi:6-phospho-beta-glucosidase